jgi:hypothetical protein
MNILNTDDLILEAIERFQKNPYVSLHMKFFISNFEIIKNKTIDLFDLNFFSLKIHLKTINH